MSSNNSENSNQIAGAITYPSNAAAVQPVSVQPRQPHNLQGLLRFAMEATKAEDAPGNSTLGPMDEERRRFLEEALRGLTVDIAEVLSRGIHVLADSDRIGGLESGQQLPEDVDTAIGNITEFIDDVDVANDFYKIGGFSIFPVCFGSQSEKVRAAASTILAELCQNNPYCQERALECGLLNVLINMAENEQDPTVLAKTVYAISCASREHEAGCQELVAQDGCRILSRLLQSEHKPVRTKAVFLIRYLCEHQPEAKAQFIERGLVRNLTELIKQGHDDASEHILSTLLALIEGLDPTVLQQCRDHNLGLRQTLQDFLKQPELQGDTSFVEEREYGQELLKQIFADWSPSNDDGAER